MTDTEKISMKEKLMNPKVLFFATGFFVVLKCFLEWLSKTYDIDILNTFLAIILFACAALATVSLGVCSFTYNKQVSKAVALGLVAICILVTAILAYDGIQIDNSDLILMITRFVEAVMFVVLAGLSYKDASKIHALIYGLMGTATLAKGLLDKFVEDEEAQKGFVMFIDSLIGAHFIALGLKA